MEVTIKPQYWTNRRTIRSYTDKPVDPSLIESLLEQAAHAPTTGNMQLYSVVASWSADEKAALAPAHFNQPQVTRAAVVLTFCADVNRYTRWLEEHGQDAGFDNLQSFMAATLDTALVAQQFNTLAEGASLGVCMLGTTTYNAADIAATLNLPHGVIPIITLTVGWPANDGAETGRLPLKAWYHNGTYAPNTAQAIKKAYADKEARPDSRQWVAENQATSLAQVFATARYPRTTNEQFSAKFLDFLRSQDIL